MTRRRQNGLYRQLVVIGRTWREGTIAKHRARKLKAEAKIRRKRRALAEYNRRHARNPVTSDDVSNLFREPTL